MSELIVIGYDEPDQAAQAYRRIQGLQGDLGVDLVGLAVVHVDEKGEVHADTASRPVGLSVGSGALWGAVLGLLFLVPGLSPLLGGTMGGLIGKLNRSGLDAPFRSQVRSLLAPGRSVVVIMASKATEDGFAAAVQPRGGTLLKTSLGDEDERALAQHLCHSD
ncbi:DUF1269 domain-containing protein [Streptomyces sp. NPDC012450]|uniref:DUF1269 domain-containing protein n=1 Tax=Streptomyces sp. NPDC012450 TaxID=3364834 RepID=UPI0036E2B666